LRYDVLELVHEREAGADVVQPLAIERGWFEAILYVELHVRSEIALIGEVDDALRGAARDRRD